MRLFALAGLLAASALVATGAPKTPIIEKVTVGQLQQTLATSPGKPDAELAQELSTLELTERLNSVLLTKLTAGVPGEKSRQELLLLADKSAFLEPPAAEIPSDSTPDPAATRQMLVNIVNYVNTTLRQLPNLIASRETTGFEDRPQEDSLEATGIVSYSYQPLHFVGKSLATVTYRDRKEVVDADITRSTKQRSKISGLTTTGEFGPILSTTLSDALKGKITWARWEQNTSGKVAVFRYAVPDEKSNYRVQFCCIVNGFNSDNTPDLQIFDEKSAYHGEVAFDPADGTILRMTLQAELPPHGLVSNAGLVVEYAPVEIAGKNYVCPARSISVLSAHTAQSHGMYSKANYQGPSKTFLNDVVFGQYRRFGSEARIVAVEDQTP
ncbi:MAG: hypothetical protein WB679_01025 [Terracidiphilus sp.]